MRINNNKLINGFLILVLICYSSVLFYLLFFSNYRRSVQGVVDYNFIPFQTIYRYIRHFEQFNVSMLTDNFFGNILAFLPLGILLPLLHKRLRYGKQVLIIAFSASSFIEINQLLYRVGTFDIDDIILNVTGAAVGYIFISLIVKKLPFTNRS